MADHKPSEPKPSDFREAPRPSGADDHVDTGTDQQPTQGGNDEKESEAHPS
ncbi:hypothetical protein [Sphingomonas sp. GC_Shp_3]|uniref:hypothetical protein n=1 Tax=Sphingomonas sp. GC_Shp_3 TaxID=2937383 RepID=UPI00226A3A7C|nr:hypothetical protein [Sphingomonas sp. GC_Shp_3]